MLSRRVFESGITTFQRRQLANILSLFVNLCKLCEITELLGIIGSATSLRAPSYNSSRRKDTSAALRVSNARRFACGFCSPFVASRHREDPRGGEGQQFLER